MVVLRVRRISGLEHLTDYACPILVTRSEQQYEELSARLAESLSYVAWQHLSNHNDVCAK